MLLENQTSFDFSSREFRLKRTEEGYSCLARKIACIVHHLLTNNEKYSEEELKGKKIKLPKLVQMQDFDIEEMIGILCKAGYTINKSSAAG